MCTFALGLTSQGKQCEGLCHTTLVMIVGNSDEKWSFEVTRVNEDAIGGLEIERYFFVGARWRCDMVETMS